LPYKFSGENICFYNPRREDWNSSWEQKIDNPHFFGQVTWELEHLERATHIVFYFQPGTMSPISLLELGLHARNKKAYVICPEGFRRKGNIDIVCQHFGVAQFAGVEAALEQILRD